jgi:hypothetical protein
VSKLLILGYVRLDVPTLTSNARVEGTVILGAIIDEEGAVQSLKVLRSVPLNGRPVPVILTVVVSFKIPAR